SVRIGCRERIAIPYWPGNSPKPQASSGPPMVPSPSRSKPLGTPVLTGAVDGVSPKLVRARPAILGRVADHAWRPPPSGRRSSPCCLLNVPGQEGLGGITGRSSRGSSTATGAGSPGATCPTISVPGRRCGSATGPGLRTGPGIASSTRCWSAPTRTGSWTGRSRSTPRSAVRTSTAPTSSAPQGALWNHKNLREEPPDHALGRSRGGLSTKIHQLVDGHGLPLVILCGPGQGGDSPMLGPLLDGLSVARPGPGRPRTRPYMLRGDKACSSRATRKTLRRRGIKTVIPEPRNQQQHRRNRGSRGGRPVNLDVEAYRGRNVIERGYSDVKQWRGLATRYDKLGLTYRAGAVLRAIVQWLNHLL